MGWGVCLDPGLLMAPALAGEDSLTSLGLSSFLGKTGTVIPT